MEKRKWSMKAKRVFTLLLIILLLVCVGCSASNDSDEPSGKSTLLTDNNAEDFAGNEINNTEINSTDVYKRQSPRGSVAWTSVASTMRKKQMPVSGFWQRVRK